MPLLETNFNDTQWLSTDRLSHFPSVFIQAWDRYKCCCYFNSSYYGHIKRVCFFFLLLFWGVGGGGLEVFLLANDYCLNTKLRTQALIKHLLSLVGK